MIVNQTDFLFVSGRSCVFVLSLTFATATALKNSKIVFIFTYFRRCLFCKQRPHAIRDSICGLKSRRIITSQQCDYESNNVRRVYSIPQCVFVHSTAGNLKSLPQTFSSRGHYKSTLYLNISILHSFHSIACVCWLLTRQMCCSAMHVSA